MAERSNQRAESFISSVAEWASGKDGIVGVVLVGSHARGEAGPDSDIDLVLVLDDEDTFTCVEEWSRDFGPTSEHSWEDWGKVQSLRVRYASGVEVEFGLSDRHWLATPIDEGTRAVLLGGVRILHDPEGYVSDQLDENLIPCDPGP